MDLSRRDQAQNAYFEVDSGKAQESIVEILREELNRKNEEIKELRKENTKLHKRAMSVDGIFQIVRIMIGEHSIDVNHFISHSCTFLVTRGLHIEFLKSLPNIVPKQEEEDE